MVDPSAQRRLAAVLAADVVEYSRLMEHDEAGTLERLNERRQNVLRPLVKYEQVRRKMGCLFERRGRQALSGQEQEYVADGLTDDLITDLSKASGLLVTARNSSFAYEGRQ